MGIDTTNYYLYALILMCVLICINTQTIRLFLYARTNFKLISKIWWKKNDATCAIFPFRSIPKKKYIFSLYKLYSVTKTKCLLIRFLSTYCWLGIRNSRATHLIYWIDFFCQNTISFTHFFINLKFDTSLRNYVDRYYEEISSNLKLKQMKLIQSKWKEVFFFF